MGQKVFKWDIERPKGVLGLQDILRLQKKLIPELVDLMEKRYNILRTIYYSQPVGRRVLANTLSLGERVVRTEVEFLKNQNLIEINAPGMTVTSEGTEILEDLKEYVHEIKGLSDVEQAIKEALNLKDVIVVSGDADDDVTILKELGKSAANYAKNQIKSGDIIAITGGSTIKQVVDSFPKMNNIKDVLVVPARGGMGRKVETQSNSLAARLAERLNGTYKLLHVPENLSNDILQTLTRQKGIQEVIQFIHKANILIYGIGRADKMGLKRGLSQEQLDRLEELGAVGEAFGCYFDEDSKVVWVTPTLGINIDDITTLNLHIAVAAGKDKVDAIIATEFGKKNGVLVTDEGAAKKIMEKLNLQV